MYRCFCSAVRAYVIHNTFSCVTLLPFLYAPVAHPTSALVFDWLPKAIEMTPDMQIPQFKLEKVIPDRPKVLNYSTGEALAAL